MLLETVACLFLFSRDDVSQGQRLTSEANEHTYGMWRMILREFNMEQLIRIVQKAIIKNNALFESGLEAFRSKSRKGYTASMTSFVDNMKNESTTCGPVHIDLNKPAVHQLWDTVYGIISFGTKLMVPFLKVFGSDEGNGLSPFAVDIKMPRYDKNVTYELICETT